MQRTRQNESLEDSLARSSGGDARALADVVLRGSNIVSSLNPSAAAQDTQGSDEELAQLLEVLRHISQVADHASLEGALAGNFLVSTCRAAALKGTEQRAWALVSLRNYATSSVGAIDCARAGGAECALDVLNDEQLRDMKIAGEPKPLKKICLEMLQDVVVAHPAPDARLLPRDSYGPVLEAMTGDADFDCAGCAFHVLAWMEGGTDETTQATFLVSRLAAAQRDAGGGQAGNAPAHIMGVLRCIEELLCGEPPPIQALACAGLAEHGLAVCRDPKWRGADEQSGQYRAIRCLATFADKAAGAMAVVKAGGVACVVDALADPTLCEPGPGLLRDAATTLLYNITRWSDVRPLLMDSSGLCPTAETLERFVDDQDEAIAFVASLGLAWLAGGQDEKDHHHIVAASRSATQICARLEIRILDPKNERGFNFNELGAAIARISINDANKTVLRESGVLPLLARALPIGLTIQEQDDPTPLVEALLQLSFEPESKEWLKEHQEKGELGATLRALVHGPSPKPTSQTPQP